MVNDADINFSSTYAVLDFTVEAGETLNLSAHASVRDISNASGGGTGIVMTLTKTDSLVTDEEIAASGTISSFSKSKNIESNILYRAKPTEQTFYHVSLSTVGGADTVPAGQLQAGYMTFAANHATPWV